MREKISNICYNLFNQENPFSFRPIFAMTATQNISRIRHRNILNNIKDQRSLKILTKCKAIKQNILFQTNLQNLRRWIWERRISLQSRKWEMVLSLNGSRWSEDGYWGYWAKTLKEQVKDFVVASKERQDLIQMKTQIWHLGFVLITTESETRRKLDTNSKLKLRRVLK